MRLILPLLFASVLSLFSTGLKAQPWKLYSDSAKLYLDQRNNVKALESYLKANESLSRDSSFSQTYAQNSNDLGDLYVAIGQYAKAEPYFVIAKELRNKIEGKESLGSAFISNSLGRLYRLLGQYDKAEALLLDALAIRERLLGKNSADYATTCNNLAIVYFELGQYEKAKPFYLGAKEIRERVLGKDHIDYAASCNNLAILYVTTGRYAEAEPLYLEAKRIREKVLGKEHPFYAASCNNLAALYMDRGQFQKAEPLYVEALQIRERTLGKEHPEYAASCDNLAILYMDRGQYEKAEPLYVGAKQIREKVLGKKHSDYARSCNNMGLYFRNLGQFKNAETLLVESREILGQVLGTEHFEYAKSCNNLGALYMDMGSFEKAGLLYEEARKIWEKVVGNEHPEYAKSCHNLALIQRNAGQYEKAEQLLLQGKSIREKVFGKENVDYAASCDNLAVLYTNMGEYKKAEALHIEAREIRQIVLGEEHPEYLTSCINLANLYRVTNEFEKANNLFTQAFHSQNIQVNKLFRFTTEREKQLYLNKINELKDYYLSFHGAGTSVRGSGYTYDISLANRQLILTSLQQMRQSVYNVHDSIINNRYNEWINTREQLAFLYTKPVSERKEEVKTLEGKADAIEKQLALSSAAFRKNQTVADWQEVKGLLRPGEAAIEFVEFQYYTGKKWTDSIYYMAVVLRKDKPGPELVRLFEKRELDALMGDVNPGQHKLAFLYSRSDNKRTSLYNVIWQPLEKMLSGINTVYFAPAGSLHKIAFAALPIGNEVVLSDKYKLIQLNTTSAIADETNNVLGVADKIVLYGGIQYDADSASMRQAVMPYNSSYFASRSFPDDRTRGGVSDFYYLPESEKETTEITKSARQKGFNVTVFNKLDASEESFKAISGNHSPSVLHLATHGFFYPDPANKKAGDPKTGVMIFQQSDNPLIRSGLAMAGANNAWKGKAIPGIEDGILTSYEVSNMNLTNAKLAVLSACETGLGEVQDSEGVYGLQRAFKIAGVENLVMSLWKVTDVESATFMQEFYKGLFAKQPISTAFYNAQQVMKNKYRSDPYKWAAWVLIR